LEKKYIYIFKFIKENPRDLEVYSFINNLNRGFISCEDYNDVYLKYVPLIIIISDIEPWKKQEQISRSNFLIYQTVLNNKMTIRNDIDSFEYEMEIRERNVKEMKKYTQRMTAKKQLLIAEIDKFKTQYSSKNVLTSSSEKLISLENELKHVNELEERFLNHLDDYFRENIMIWNVADYAYKKDNYVNDYILKEYEGKNYLPDLSEISIMIPNLSNQISLAKSNANEASLKTNKNIDKLSARGIPIIISSDLQIQSLSTELPLMTSFGKSETERCSRPEPFPVVSSETQPASQKLSIPKSFFDSVVPILGKRRSLS
jgi:hypothetical protein